MMLRLPNDSRIDACLRIRRHFAALARSYCFAVCAVLSLLLTPHAAASSREYAIKAAFLYHFTRYVQWPSAAGSADDVFVVGVLGDDPFGEHLAEITKKKTADDRKIAVRRFKELDEYTPCHILFVSASEADQLEATLAKLRGAYALIVGDTGGYARRGVMVNFYLEQNKVRIEVNRGAAEREGLKISSKLLRLARIVQGRENRS